MISGDVAKYRFQALDGASQSLVKVSSRLLGLGYLTVSEVGPSELEMYVNAPRGMHWQTLSW